MTLTELQSIHDRGTVMVSRDGLIAEINDAFTKILGWSRDQVIGQPLSMIIPPRMRDAHHMGFSRFLYTEKPTLMNKPLRLPTLHQSGAELSAEYIIFAEKKDNGWFFGAVITPCPSGNGS